MSKPHIKKVNGKWFVWRSAKDSKQSIPVVEGMNPQHALSKYVQYMRISYEPY